MPIRIGPPARTARRRPVCSIAHLASRWATLTVSTTRGCDTRTILWQGKEKATKGRASTSWAFEVRGKRNNRPMGRRPASLARGMSGVPTKFLLFSFLISFSRESRWTSTNCPDSPSAQSLNLVGLQRNDRSIVCSRHIASGCGPINAAGRIGRRIHSSNTSFRPDRRVKAL